MDKIKVTARRTARAVGETEQSVKKLQKSAMQASASLATAGFALSFVGKKMMGLTAHATTTAMGFEAAMSRVQFATKATGADMKFLTKEMLDLGLKTIETPTSAAEAFRQLRTAGLDTNEALKLLPMTIQMVTGAGGLIDMNTAVRASVSAIKKFGSESVSFQQVMDTMANATRTTALSWEHMAPFLNSLRAAPLLMQSSMSTMMALGGVMKAGGMQAAQAGESVAILSNKLIGNERIISNFMTKKGLTTKQEFMELDPSELRRRMISFQQMRVDLFDEAGKIRDINVVLAEALGEYQTLLAKGGDKKALEGLTGVFGQKAGAMILMLNKLTTEGKSAKKMMLELSASVADSTGSSKEAEDAYLATAEGIAKLIEGSKLTIATIFGKSTMGIVSKALTVWKEFLNTILSITEANPILTKTLMIVTSALGALATASGLALLGLGGILFFTQVLGPALGVGGFAGAITLAFTALKSGLVGLIVPAVWLGVILVGVLAIVGAVSWVTNSSDTMAKRFRHNFRMIKLVVQGVIEWWDGKGGPNSTLLFKTLDKHGLKNIVVSLLQFKGFFTKIFRGIGQTFTFFWGHIKNILGVVAYGFLSLMEVIGLFAQVADPKDISGYTRALEILGNLIGAVLVGYMVNFAAQTAVATTKMLALGTAGLIANVKIFAVAVAIAAAIAGYAYLMSLATDVGDQLGLSLWGWVDAWAVKKAKMGLVITEFGYGVANWFKDGFTNGFSGFLEHAKNQLKALWALVKLALGMGSALNARVKAEQAGLIHRVGTPDLGGDTLARLGAAAASPFSTPQERAAYSDEFDHRVNQGTMRQATLARTGRRTERPAIDEWNSPDTITRGTPSPALGAAGSMVGGIGGKSAGAVVENVNITVNGAVNDENARTLAKTMVQEFFDANFETSYQP